MSVMDVEELARFSTEVYNAIAVLESMGSENEMNNFRTISLLVEKLPLDSQHAWGSYGRQHADEHGDVTCRTFCDFLEEHAQDRQFSAVRAEPGSREPTRKPRPLPRKVRQSYAMDSAAEVGRVAASDATSPSGQGTRSRAQVSCYFCKQPHWISRCKAFQELTGDRRWKWTESNSACVRCLSTSHRTQQCHRQLPCGVDGCKEKHHALLHTKPQTTAVVGTVNADRKVMLMKTVVVRVHGPSVTRQCVAYLDEGSSLTLIESDLAEELGLDTMPDKMRIRTMTGVTEHEVGKLDLLVSSAETGNEFELKDAVAINKLELSRSPVTMTDLAKKYPLLETMAIPYLDEAPRMIIGMDNAELIATRQLRRTTKNGPLLQKTLLGWTVTGRALAAVTVTDEQVQFIRRHEDDCTLLDETFRASWTTESFGCVYDKDTPDSPEDRRAESTLQQEVFHNGERWVAPILLRDSQAVFPPSRTMAERRAKTLERKLDKTEKSGDGKSAKLVYEKMDEMIRNGHFRRLSTEEAAKETDRTWYLPLLAVTNKMKPEKVRLVLDAAARSQDRCLNDYLMRGPDFSNSIPGIICRWREKPIAVTSDVKAMFSQILVRDQDRACLRFLWRGRRRTGPVDTYESQVVIFGAKSSPAVAGYCFRETGKRFGSQLPHVMDAIENCTYVDDIIYSVNTENEAIKFIEDMTSTLAQGGFELSDWTSNTATVVKDGSGNETSLEENVTLGVTDSQRTLGTVWKPSSDSHTDGWADMPRLKDKTISGNEYIC
ncbi:uncharacterized protein LOC122390886 [Amphibalanus amphitrite]|uniref:uncharacterized protein LOC122390886 n=1 Tax=Amphibalanus amphitrite TaxID=1232801 RepID=UPI001C905A33|nr:uncharacterized protein LOC122390886 [Amphibalanus amphitrite]